jgi:protein CpxP
MKKLLLLCCIMLGITAVSRAQGGGRPQMSPVDQAAALKTSLALTDDQTAKITVIYTAQAKSRDSLMTAANGDMQSVRPAMTAIRTATTTKIKAVLTPDQATAWQKQMDDARAKRAGGGGPPQR